MGQLDIIDRKLLNNLQARFPVVEKPYAAIAELVGIEESDVLRRVQSFIDQGIIRNISYAPEPRRFGYNHVMCAVEVSSDKLEQIATRICQYAEVTQCSHRQAAFNIWFTLVVQDDNRIDEILREIRSWSGVWDIANFAADGFFKVNSFFDFNPNRDVRTMMPEEAWRNEIARFNKVLPVDRPLTDQEVALFHVLDDGLPVSPTPFKDIAYQLGMSVDNAIGLIRKAIDEHTIRKFGAFIGHHAAGFLSNSLVVWEVPKNEIEETGKRLARYSCITRCYARPTIERWEYRLYTNIHGRFEEEVLHYVNRIAYMERVQSWRILFSLKEFKRELPQLFVVDPVV